MNEETGYQRKTDEGPSTMEIVNKMAGRYRNPPRAEFLKYTIEYLTDHMKLTSIQTQRLFDRALNEFDIFPSISQIIELKNSLVRDRDPLFAPKPKPALPPPTHGARAPWSSSLIGLLVGFDDPRGVSPAGLRCLKLDRDEAKYLYDCWKEKKWDDDWAKEIMAKCNFSMENLI